MVLIITELLESTIGSKEHIEATLFGLHRSGLTGQENAHLRRTIVEAAYGKDSTRLVRRKL